MSGNVSSQRVTSGVAVPGLPTTVAQLIEEFPELEAEFARTTAWREGPGSLDRKSKAFERMFPSQRPAP